ncbi:MAG: class II glutamine amidotransferase [Candidatus Micrarchaeaceae archaeon]
MCRMGFVSSDHNVEETSYIRSATSFYGKSQRDGMGYAYVVRDSIESFKTPQAAPIYWNTHPTTKRIYTKSIIWHTRFASNGAVAFRNTHPFVNGSVALAHNGVLHNFTAAKNELAANGYVFESDTDSEIILAAYMLHGLEFIEYLRARGVTGSLTVMILTRKNILLYTNANAMVIYHTRVNDVNYLYGVSDTSFLGYFKSRPIKNYVLYSISEASIKALKYVEFPAKSYSVEYGDFSSGDDWWVKYVDRSQQKL